MLYLEKVIDFKRDTQRTKSWNPEFNPARNDYAAVLRN